MSCTSVYAVYKTKAVCIGEFRNGHGSGPAIWDYISQKCLGEPFSMLNADSFWGLYKDKNLTDKDRAVLLCTYDMAYIERDKLLEFADACEQVHADIISNTGWVWNHFKDIGIAAKALADKHDHRCLGFGVGCTSVSDPWEGHNFMQGEAWPVYAEINSIASEEQ